MRTPPRPSNGPFDTAALSLLACPVCLAKLMLSGEQGAEKEIVCTGCRRRYPVRDGLAILLASAAIG